MDTWPREAVQWGPPLDLSLFETRKAHKTTLADVIRKSNEFPLEFPENFTRNSHLVAQVAEKNLEEKIQTAYPMIHEQSLRLYVVFLRQKRRFGNAVERRFYENMSIVDLVDRLLTKRPAAFFGMNDEYLLLNKIKGEGGWEKVGTENESYPLVLDRCLSYDEIKLSALLSVSSPSYLIDGQVRGEGIVVGVVGARLEKELVMEYREVMKTKVQNTHLHGYGHFFLPTMQGVFMNFYEDISATFDELTRRGEFENKQRYLKIEDDKYFDRLVYARRVSLSIDCLLFEANDRAERQKKQADLYVVGLGHDNWRIVSEQDQIFLDTFLKRIEFLGKALCSINAVYFTPIGCLSIKKVPIEDHVNGGIIVAVRDWSIDTVRGSGEDKVVVLSYNWNGNALPGDQYWLHNFQADDVATRTQIAENQNPYINSNVSGANLRVVTLQGLVTFEEYAGKIKNALKE